MQKKFHDVLPIYAEMIDPSVKSWARCQYYSTRALKWGILQLSTLNISRDTIKFRIMLVF